MKRSTMNNVKLYKHFNDNKDKLDDYTFLYDTLKPLCRFKRVGLTGGKYMKILQAPYELSNFLLFLREHKIKSYLEIGTSRGGSFYTVDSYLRNVFDDYKGSLGYDLRFKLRNFDAYKKMFPSFNFTVGNSNDIEIPGQWDFGFIDAFHKDYQVLKDLVLLEPHCKYIGFHDIVLDIDDEKHADKGRKRSSVFNAWKQIKQKYEHWEFIDESLPETPGIGVIKI